MADPNRELYLRMVERRTDLDGRFTRIRRLGTSGGGGHFSLLFSALDNQTNRRVAIKVFHPDQRNDTYRLDCFAREASLLAQLTEKRRVVALVTPQSHFVEPVPTTVGVPFNTRFDFYALELARTDAALVLESGKWDAERRLMAFRDMCRSVNQLHDVRIAHRDLKPGNFLVVRRGRRERIKVSDLGTARPVDDDLTQLLPVYSHPPGDLRYAAPEMLAALHDVKPEIALNADFFSLGAILFELFSGQILNLHLTSDPGYLRGLGAAGLVGQEDRLRIYDQLLPQITARSLPSVHQFDCLAPEVVLRRIDDLYREMAALNYHRRLCDFHRIIRMIDACLLVLRNHQKVAHWERNRARREEQLQAKLRRRKRAQPMRSSSRRGGTL